LGILHIVAFVTLCKFYMGFDPHSDLQNYFFHVWLPQGSDIEVVVLGGTVIHVMSGHGVNPYFDLPMPESLNGWQKIWFFLRNDGTIALPVFTGNCPVPQPN
jgi:hypothetical protein